mgnify:CR=1 FL=1
MRKTFLFVLSLLICAVLCTAAVFAAEQTVYVKDGGTGDGLTPGSPVGSLTKAYDALDLTKDCTVVLCGKFTQNANFTRTASYTARTTVRQTTQSMKSTTNGFTSLVRQPSSTWIST